MSQEMDYEKQFQADLERAQALSLESLALEKYRMQKKLDRLQSELNRVNSHSSTASTPESTSESLVKPDRDRTQFISRPRPGSFNTGQSNSMIAPPPSNQRRNSASASTNLPNPSDETDLISFTSPTQSTGVRNSLKDLCDQLHTFANRPSDLGDFTEPTKSSTIADHIKGLYPSLSQVSLTTPQLPPKRPIQPPTYGFQPHVSAGLNLMTGVTPLNSGYQYPPVVPQIPPLPTNYIPRVEPPKLVLPAISSGANIDVFKAISKQDNSNLIDLSTNDVNLLGGVDTDKRTNVRVSVLEIFDPLLTDPNSNGETSTAAVTSTIVDDAASECSGSMYNEYDPFDYLYNTGSGAPSIADPIYAAVVRSDMAPLSPQSPPPLPPRAVWSTLEKKRKTIDVHQKKKNRLYENITLVKRKATHHDCDLRAFYILVKELRGRYIFNDSDTNPGVVISPMISSQYREGTSIKLMVYPMSDISSAILESPKPISFTCDVSCSVEHVILHVLCEMDKSPEAAHRLQVWGAVEYLAPGTTLAEYEYVHHCIKLEQDVIFSLVPERLVDCSLARTMAEYCTTYYSHFRLCIRTIRNSTNKSIGTGFPRIIEETKPLVFSCVILLFAGAQDDPLLLNCYHEVVQDDRRDSELTIDDLLPNEPGFPISYDTLIILLETLEKEMERAETSALEITSPALLSSPQYSNRVIQGVKAICALMGAVETPDITEAVEKFADACSPNSKIYRSDLYQSDENLSTGRSDHNPINFSEIIRAHCERIRGAVQGLVDMYCQAFRVDFQLNIRNEMPSTSMAVCDVLDSILVHVSALHRVPSCWKHADYLIGAQVYHGTRPVGAPVLSPPTAVSTSFFPRIRFNSWLDMEGMSICQLAREARLVLVLYGRTLIPAEKDDTNPTPKYTQEELGWAALQFFDQNGIFTQGNLLVSLWPSVADKRLGPAPCPGSHPVSDHPLLGVEIPSPAGRIVFPSTPPQSPNNREPIGEFASLDENTQQQLLDIVEMDIFCRHPVECREVLWEKRHYLHHLSEALPKVLLAAHSWDWACLADLHSMLHSWTPMPPVQALQLLLPCFPDMEVRRCAVNWVKKIGNDELADYLPQLVQALKHETYEASPLAQLLLERALASPRVAHNLYWLLTHSLPGACPQNSQWEGVSQDEFSVGAARHYRRLMLMLRALLAISGDAQRNRFMSQQLLVKSLHEVAENVQHTKESLRLKNLLTNLESVHQTLHDNPTCLPLSPSLFVNGVQVRTCSYFPSNTLPLKINFLAPSSTVIPAIVKVGDDLQQDMLTLQMVRIMDKLWLKEGLDLKMVAFSCVPTGHKRGMIEMVSGAETLRKIQIEWGLTGSFKDKPIAEWLAKHNPSELEYERAVENFTASCAGYSVVTYILGICDRHNDNIMLKTSGHIFHIDFGKFLGDAQMFGNFKRDRTPFVLTSDMAYVINGGDRPSARFHQFVDLCCQAFNIVRKHGNLILHLFALMASSGIPGVTMEAVSYVRKALLPGQSNPEAAAVFARLIESSLKSWFTQFNFFLHNLSQLRFTGDHGDGELLSFVPKTYSLLMDGRLLGVQVLGYQKRYDPDKHYVYIIRVDRVNQPDPAHVLRSYREFTELYQKICLHFPLAKVHR